MKYQNGNALISIDTDGTRTIDYKDQLILEYPLNIDIRVSNKCSFGLNADTGKAFCSFCHESARTDGFECDFSTLKDKLVGLPKGIELAVGSNELTENLVVFLEWSKSQGYIVNLTINQGHILRDVERIKHCIKNDLVKGIGVSYRSGLRWNVPQFVLDYPNTIFHVIAGIDEINDVLSLAEKGVKKILILGEKDFGFNSGKVNLANYNHKRWLWWVSKTFVVFDVVSFDNLGIEQLKIRRFLSDKDWQSFYQGEHSFYVNAVDGYFAPSSRNSKKTNWNDTNAKSYFESITSSPQ